MGTQSALKYSNIDFYKPQMDPSSKENRGIILEKKPKAATVPKAGSRHTGFFFRGDLKKPPERQQRLILDGEQEEIEVIDLVSDSDEAQNAKIIEIGSQSSKTASPIDKTQFAYYSSKEKEYVYKNRQFAIIGPQEFKILNSKLFLNDNIIMSYLYYLAEGNEWLDRSVYICDSYFFEKLKPQPVTLESLIEAHNFVKREPDLFSKQYWLVPICSHSHWLLIIIANPAKLIYSSDQGGKMIILDSFTRASYGALIRPLAAFVRFEFLVREKEGVDSSRQQLLRSKVLKEVLNTQMPCKYSAFEVPQQTNSYDCGIYMLHNAELFLQNPEKFIEFHSQSERGFDLYDKREVKGKRRLLAKVFKVLADRELKK